MLWELVYNSIAYPAAPSDDALAHLVDAARARNRQLGITGVLLHHNGEYVQLLEGEREVVETLFRARIARDPRHRGVTVCWEQAIAVRGFEDWSMGLCCGSALAEIAGVEDAESASCLQSLDFSGPGSEGRKVLLSIYAAIRAGA